jgi:hypothetical protein
VDEPKPLNENTPLDRNSFGRKAAIISFWSSIVGLFAVAILAVVLQQLGGKKPAIMFAAMGAGALMWLNGLAMGAVALRGMRESGRQGILGRVLAGLALNGLFLAMACGAVYFVVHEQNLKQAQSNAAAQASNKILNRVLLLQREFVNSQWALTNPPVLEMSSVQSREDLEKRRQAVRKFIHANEAMQEICANAMQLYREELIRIQTPPGLGKACTSSKNRPGWTTP